MMRKYKGKTAVVLVLTLVIGMTGCSRAEDFNAEAYVKVCMDARYRGEYKGYADCLGISEDEAKKQIEESFEKSIAAQFEVSDGISEEGIADYIEKMREVSGLAKYEILEAAETEDGNYMVKVRVEPSDVFETVLCKSVQKSIDGNTYGSPSTVEVTVTKDDSGVYILEEMEMDRLEAAMFPSE